MPTPIPTPKQKPMKHRSEHWKRSARPPLAGANGRQASESEETLGFQIAPGVAEVATAKSRGLTAEAGRVVFLVDGDEGGRENRKKLIDGGIESDHIVVLHVDTGKTDEALETEDLIDGDTYALAVNRELGCWNDNPPEATKSDVGSE